MEENKKMASGGSKGGGLRSGETKGARGKIASILKFVFFLLILPLVVGSTIGFIKELRALPADLMDYFVNGVLVYLIIHVFIYEPQPIYQYGQRIVSAIFGFVSPLVKIAPFVLPIYSIIFLILFYFATLIFKSAQWGGYFMFLVSFTLTMHMVFTAKSLREKDSNVVKPNYFFLMSVVYLIDIFILALLLDLILVDFSFSNFFRTATGVTGSVYLAVFKQLFVP